MQASSGGGRIPLKWADEEEQTRARRPSFISLPLYLK